MFIRMRAEEIRQWCTPPPSPAQPAAAVTCSASKRFHLKVRNHGEGPYEGLLLVESGYYRFHI